MCPLRSGGSTLLAAGIRFHTALISHYIYLYFIYNSIYFGQFCGFVMPWQRDAWSICSFTRRRINFWWREEQKKTKNKEPSERRRCREEANADSIFAWLHLCFGNSNTIIIVCMSIWHPPDPPGLPVIENGSKSKRFVSYPLLRVPCFWPSKRLSFHRQNTHTRHIFTAVNECVSLVCSFAYIVGIYLHKKSFDETIKTMLTPISIISRLATVFNSSFTRFHIAETVACRSPHTHVCFGSDVGGRGGGLWLNYPTIPNPIYHRRQFHISSVPFCECDNR